VASAAIGTYYLLPAAGVAQAVLFVLFSAAAMCAAWRASRRAEGTDRFVWASVAIALTLATLANVPYYGFPLLVGRPIPFPCPVDVLFLSTQPCFIVALLALAKDRRRVDRAGDALDAAIVVVGGASLMWHFVIAPVVSQSGMSGLAHVAAVAYPVSDLMVFSVLARLVLAVSDRSASMQLLLAGIGSLLAADVLLATQLSSGSYHLGGPVDGMWMAYYALIAVAALHPSARRLSRRSAVVEKGISSARLAIMCGMVLVGPLVFVTSRDGAAFVAAASLVAFALVMTRMMGLNRRLMSAGVALQRRASTDLLTGLANRAEFRHRLQLALTLIEDHAGDVALLFLDLDDFKDVNDTLGHPTGDALLEVVAYRLQQVVRSDDLVARLGGDEFAMLFEGPDALAQAMTVGERAIDALAEPVVVSGTPVRVGVSVGLATSYDGCDLDGLMREADVAMYSAKRLGKNRFERYDINLDDAVSERRSLMADVDNAAERGELVVEYQPVVDLATGAVLGVDALVRWQHPTRGLLPPSAFIALAEETGAVAAIGSWVLDTGARDLCAWQHRYDLRELVLNVNVSVGELEDPGYANRVADILGRAGLDPRCLVVEVTASVLADPAGGAAKTLAALRSMGARVALNDFATGYSCLASLPTFPADIIKIDGSFISGNQRGDRDEVIVDVILDIGRRLGLDTVAEGIEHVDQLLRLRNVGCRSGQGVLLSRPVPASVIEELLSAGSPLLPLPHRPTSQLLTRSA
jgi:diguanylate cyclase (GGDEF)-like protein